MTKFCDPKSNNKRYVQIHYGENRHKLKFYIEFNPCRECKDIIREINESMHIDDNSKKLLRHITYNHTEVVQAIIEEIPKKADKENFPWFG